MENHKETGEKCPECGSDDKNKWGAIHDAKFNDFFKCPDRWHDQALKQKDLDPEVADFINENFHDLLEAPKQDDDKMWLRAMDGFFGMGGDYTQGDAALGRFIWNAAIAHERKSDDRLKETEEIIAHFLAFLGPQFESLRDELLKKADDFLRRENN